MKPAPPDWGAIKAQILSRVQMPETGCWLWTGAVDWSGYGRMRFRGENRRVMRVMWSAHNRQEWPKGMHCLHSCDVRLCVNPEHLRPGTSADNRRDAMEPGRAKPRPRKTHCPQGHPYSGDNAVYYPAHKWPYCRACQRARSKINNEKIRLAKLEQAREA